MLILRSIRFNNNYVALLIINSYDNYEKDNFKKMCNKNVDNEEPTDNLYFLTSLKDNEISQMKLNFFLLVFN